MREELRNAGELSLSVTRQRPRVSEFRNLGVVLWDQSACIRMRFPHQNRYPVRSEGGISAEVKGSVPRFREDRQCVRGERTNKVKRWDRPVLIVSVLGPNLEETSNPAR